MPEDHMPTDNDIKFLKALKNELRNQAVAFKAKKDGTVNQHVFIGLPPLSYSFFYPSI